MPGRDRYITLMSSLPHTGQLFISKETPCSRYKLDSRLHMLTAEDAALLQQIEDILQWSHQPITRTDAEFIARAQTLTPQLASETIRNVVEYRLEVRTLVTALRRRQRGDPSPAAKTQWGYGRWVDHIRRHWTEPTFRLERAFPWLTEANRYINASDSVGLERLLLGITWERLGNAMVEHDFNFEAVVIYVLRWNIIDRWTTYSGKAALERFHSMVETGLGEFGEVKPAKPDK